MFSTARLFIKTGLVFLAAGLLLGGYLLAVRELTGSWPSQYLVSAHVHAVGIGFLMFMILGVAVWLFPRPDRADTRYRPERIVLSYWLLLVGTGLRVATEVLRTGLDAWWLRATVLACGLLQIVGLAVYFVTMWSRIRPIGSAAREDRGERF